AKGGAIASPHIALTAVNKEFATKRGPTVALRDVNMSVERGSFVSICGPSGCGKSTLLTLIGGLLEPTSGLIEVEGRPVKGPQPAVGTVFQDASLMPWRTVMSNIMYPVELRKAPIAEYAEHAKSLLDLVNLRRFADHYPHELSGGMRQRVGICRALIMN